MYDTPAAQVRLLISDVDPAREILADDSVQGFLAINAQNARRAAADALDSIADSEALVSKVITTQDLSTDGAKLADSLRKHADRLRSQADAEDDAGEGGTFAFQVIPLGPAVTPELSEPELWGL